MQAACDGRGSVPASRSVPSLAVCGVGFTDSAWIILAGFISVNQAGVDMCANRLSYLVAKGGRSAPCSGVTMPGILS